MAVPLENHGTEHFATYDQVTIKCEHYKSS